MNPQNEDVPNAADIPCITPAMVAETDAEIAKRRTDRHISSLVDVADALCRVCGAMTVSFADDLTFSGAMAGKQVVIPNLSGVRCSKCGDFAFDADASKRISECT